jgi:predicted Rossmann fold nucleotide-binding protein DprA/Smf involved in DNA uptake
MPENRAPEDASPRKPTAVILRKRRGPPSDELLQRQREYNRVRRMITEAIRSDPKTVPEIATHAGLPTHQVFWHLMAMKKYGKVVEGEESGDYYKYALKEEEQQGSPK